MRTTEFSHRSSLDRGSLEVRVNEESPAQRRVLAVYAHPDDEGQASGTLAAFVAHGHRVTLVCATRGEVGEISDLSLSTAETLWYTRELELRAAMAQISVSDVRFLPYRDSGMAGTPENDDRTCLHRQPAGSVVETLVAIMREVRPHIVITWDPTGGYGHLDHLAVHRHTVAAFDAAGDADAFPDAGARWSPERLYWSAFALKRYAKLLFEMERRGLEPPPIGDELRELLANSMKDPDPVVSVVQDVRPYLELTLRASSMHSSQFGESRGFANLPDDLRESVLGEERFYRAHPPWPPGAEAEAGFEDLRAGGSTT